MAQQFSSQQIKIRTALLIFIKGSAAPIVLYVENPQLVYEEFQQLLKSQVSAIVEKEGTGTLKKLTLHSNQISAVALQDEQYV